MTVDTLVHSRQAFQRLSATAPARLKKQNSEKIELAAKLVEQTQDKLRRNDSIPERMVSFFDSETRVIVKGKLVKPVEIG